MAQPTVVAHERIQMTEPTHPQSGGTPISSLRNLGPATEAAFARAGITSAEEVRTLGPDLAYLRLLQSGAAPHFIGYYVLVMALQNRPWTDCKGEEKRRLREKFDDLKRSGHDKGRSDLEAALNSIGVVPGSGSGKAL